MALPVAPLSMDKFTYVVLSSTLLVALTQPRAALVIPLVASSTVEVIAATPATSVVKLVVVHKEQNAVAARAVTRRRLPATLSLPHASPSAHSPASTGSVPLSINALVTQVGKVLLVTFLSVHPPAL